MRSSSPLLLVLPLLGVVSMVSCAEGTPSDNWVIPGKPDASVGGGAGQAGSSGQAGAAGEPASGGASNGGSANGGSANGGSANGGSANGGSSNGGSSNGGSANGGSSNGGSANGGSSGAGTGGTSCTPPVSGGACDTIPQCGCKSGEACDVAYLGGETKCFASGNIQRGTTCDALGSCAAGLTCVGSACKPYCNTDTDCSSVSGSSCFDVMYTAADGGTGTIPQMHVCTDQCDLRTNAKCGTGAACYPFDDLGVLQGRSVCVGDAGTSTTSCSETVGCAAGYACMADNTCHRWCRADTDSDCKSGESCLQLSDSSTSTTGYFYVGNQGFGICGS